MNSYTSGPKEPNMAIPRKRILTYQSWPLAFLNPQTLAACGLYYTGLEDVVTCFFCGGSLGHWKLGDDPWKEHEKYFPHCGFLKLVKYHNKGDSSSDSHQNVVNFEEIVRQASDIFPTRVMQELVIPHLQKSNRNFASLDELCSSIMEDFFSTASSKDEKRLQLAKQSSNSTFTCKICMDREMGVVFQPCGHLVSCLTCALLLHDCPLCRKAIVNKVRTFIS